MGADNLILAYLAGVIDSDGCIRVKKSDYSMRVLKSAHQWIYSETISCRQVEPQAVDLLHKTFGGYKGIAKPPSPTSRELHSWSVSQKKAGRALVMLLPYLRIKVEQANNALRLRALLDQPKKWDIPEILPERLVTATEFAQIVGCPQASILQAARLGSIPSIKVRGSRMVPLSFAETYKARMLNGGHPSRSEDTTNAMEECYRTSRRLNKVGAR